MSSGPCCPPSDCGCGNWLQSWCDWQTVTHRYCGASQVFAFARSGSIASDAVRPESGVYQADQLFYLSTEEQEFSTGTGAVITTADGEEWQVYSLQYLRSFCVWKLWCRNVAACFQLSDRVEVYEVEQCEAECPPAVQWKLLGRTRGRVLPTGGRQSMENDADRMVVSFTMELAEWKFGEFPRAVHRLKVRDYWYRVVQFENRGSFVPYVLVLERIE